MSIFSGLKPKKHVGVAPPAKVSAESVSGHGVNAVSNAALSEMPLEKQIAQRLMHWNTSSGREMMLTGERYYCNQNDILSRMRWYLSDGVKKFDNGVSNNRIAHGFLRKLVDQKTGYLLSRPFAFVTDDDDFRSAMSKIVTEKFRRLIKDVCEESVIKGIGWLQVYYDEQGELSFRKIPSEQVIPIWADSGHTEISAVIRTYQSTPLDGIPTVTVEYWDKTGVRYFIADGEQVNQDPYRLELYPHFYSGTVVSSELTQAGRQGLNWNKIPFIPIKYNKYELPLIQFVKELIDDYDRVKSDASNTLEDLPNSMVILKDYDGTDLSEFRKNLAHYRAVKVRGTGGVSVVSVPFDSVAVLNHLQADASDIFSFGRGVELTSEKFSSPNQLTVQSLYSDLDMDCNIMENEFKASFEQLVWFCKQHFVNTGVGDFSDSDIEVILSRNMLMNEMETIAAVKESMGMLSQKTCLANHPWVSDVNVEQERIQLEQISQAVE